MAKFCPQALENGTCITESCPFNHNIPVCEPCRRIFLTAKGLQSHLTSKKHKKVASGRNFVFHCSICQINVGAPLRNGHLESIRHQENCEAEGVSPLLDPEETMTRPGMVYCDLCQVQLPRTSWGQHSQGVKHQMKERYTSYKTALDEAEKNKNGITIPADLDFGVVEDDLAHRGVSAEYVIKTDIPTSQVLLTEVQLASAKGHFQSSAFSVKINGSNRTIKFSQPITFNVSFRHSHRGRYYDRLDFVFEDVLLRKRFLISRPLNAIVGSQTDHELLKPKSPYKPRERRTRQCETEVVPGVPPPSLEAIPWKIKLPKAEIPRSLATSLSNGSPSVVLGNMRKLFLPKEFKSETYERYFQYLLWIEEYRMEHDLEAYDMPNAALSSYRPYFFLSVPGLAENRPSVIVGDRILFQRHGARQGHWYEGAVHIVRKLEVGVRFNASFGGWSKEQVYNVHFKLNRYPLRRQHQALNTTFTPNRLLFPSEAHIQTRQYPSRTSIRSTVINPLIGQNPPQLQAVVSIVNQKAGSTPFVVFGPPGTGKTVTIVEAILQILRNNPKARILACAPSNSAADLIAIRLTALNSDELFRFYAPSRSKEVVPDALRKYSCWRAGARDGEHGSHSLPPLARVKQFKVIVTTCVSASFAYGVGIARGHFSHIFMDEAGQATEPEIMIAVKTMADNFTNVILSGDPKQLGPIIRSNIARELGLEQSYLERLMNHEIYDDKKGHGVTVVKLVKNFRSHNAILKFPNEQFYKGELEQCADTKIINSYIGSPHLVSKKFPIVFHAISGKDDREASSPSFFNIDEASQVKAYVRALRSDNRYRISDNDIGVITPYHAQCLKIRNVLRAVADGVKVGSVEEFQGQERRVIIISTVRSSRDFIQYDLKHTLGFVANPRRFNVAVTRAQALLIVIGDPNVLSLDPLWRAFLNYIHNNGGWKGDPITWNPKAPVEEEGRYDQVVRASAEVDMNDFTRKMELLTLENVDATDADVNPEVNVDRPWRDME